MAHDLPDLANARRIVLKLGTQIVVDAEGRVARERLAGVLRQCAALWERGAELLIVTSGAVGLGRRMTAHAIDDSLAAKQAYAAIGQAHLVETYRELLAEHDMPVAQVLLTSSNFGSRRQYLRVRDTLEKLIEMRVVPLINENDTVSTEELAATGRSQSFGDNDVLSALVAGKTDADVLVILTDVDAIYDKNPVTNADAKRIPVVPELAALSEINTDGKSALGRGGVRSKLAAARIASICGVATWITSGLRE
ncbi:MAG: glutamate 5-kinase, partial [Planctomycetes bacterium]|nr:glutamate 5-kinase [Planctomycetota bacterium]